MTGFEPQSGDEHKRKALLYAAIDDDKARQEFFTKHSARYFELARLPYFDPVRMTVFDPMHNILLGEEKYCAILLLTTVLSLGVMKTQWYDAWIQTNALRQRTATLKVARELDDIHRFLDLVSSILHLFASKTSHEPYFG